MAIREYPGLEIHEDVVAMLKQITDRDAQLVKRSTEVIEPVTQDHPQASQFRVALVSHLGNIPDSGGNQSVVLCTRRPSTIENTSRVLSGVFTASRVLPSGVIASGRTCPLSKVMKEGDCACAVAVIPKVATRSRESVNDWIVERDVRNKPVIV